jgi:hypothetical protein
MNIAIILSVSDYPGGNSLPGCILDGEIMKTLLESTRKYDSILYINKNTNSLIVKEQISKFIRDNKAQEIDEIFFYYTGHGDFRNNDFLYVLSDFEENQYRQTSLSNSELDDFLRQLNPKLTIKVIDACHSGVTYVKDTNVFIKNIDKSKEQFNSCYFMFSSMPEKSCYQTETISYFTKSFIDSVLKYPSTDIRYRHITDYISDDFENNPLQKPFFVTQADHTEIFCSVDENLKEILSAQMNCPRKEESITDELKALSFVDLVKEDAERYCSREEAWNLLASIK